MSYNYVVTAQKPTAVNGCVTGEAAEGWRPRRGRELGGNLGLGRPAAPGAAGGEWKLPAAEEPLVYFRGPVSTRAFWREREAAFEGPLSSREVT